MALRGIMCLEGLLRLQPSHPAMRGLLRNIPTLSCALISTNVQHVSCQSHLLSKNRQKSKYGSYSQFTTLATQQICQKSLNGNMLSRQNVAESRSGQAESIRLAQAQAMVMGQSPVIHQRAGIHQQSPDGNKQAHSNFILTPKGLYQASPESWKPYLSLIRLDRPIGTWLLFLPCTWSISLAAPAGCLPDLTMLGLFAMGSFFMRGAGCTINDMWDKDFDSRVARTKDRPLACGSITYLGALTFLGLQLSAALAILLTMNWNTVFLGAAAMIPVIIYPLMKRVTYWPQIFLGLTFNWGALMGWSAIQGSCDLAVCLPLYASGIAWTLVYDTIYAHQDKEDDILIGVKSTALGLGERTKPWLLGFGGVMVGGLATTGLLCQQTWPYFLGVGGIGAHLLYQILTVDLNNADDCGRKFRSNRNLGIMFWMMIMMANILKKEAEDSDRDQDTAS